MTPPSPFDQLRQFLKDMFQFEEHDLDFGIYRITRMKRQFIQAFIDGEDENSLRSTVSRALGSVQNSQSTTARNWLAAFAAQFGDMGRPTWQAVEADPADEAALGRLKSLFGMPVLSDEQRQQAEAQLRTFLETRQLSAEQLETRIYNHLLNFFELYYQNGDFGYNTRAASTFKMPYEADYNGSDTLFHWKHKDSYYIKTGNGFHSVRCEVYGKWLEFRLTSSGDKVAESSTRNNNKESACKHYRLLDIQPVEEQGADGNARTIWQLRFALAESSTPKVELYRSIWQSVFAGDETDLTPYLYKKPGKGEEEPDTPLFNDLKDDFDKADGGQVKGIGQLRLTFDQYIQELAKRGEFADLGSNAGERSEELNNDWVAIALWQLDRNLNKFYVGNDADYFIHKDLQGFLTREKSRFIKQVVFSDLNALLHAGEDNATVLIARAFNQVADTLIGFLAAIESFQKGLFELKKKVVDTHYLISVGKIPVHFHARVFANQDQRDEWRDTFKLEVEAAADLVAHPTLVVDTSLYLDSDLEFQDDLLSLPEFDNLDEQINGVLINSENWQALNLLQEKFREQIKCIYIDPPYNTGGDGFLYKDSFRHSSWASMMGQNLALAKALMPRDGLLFSSIDSNEKSSLQAVLKSVFSEFPTLEIIRSTGTPTAQGTTGLSNTYDSILIAAKEEKASLQGLPLSEEDRRIYNKQDSKGRYLTRSLRMTGEEDRREDRPDMYYGVEAPNGDMVYPIGPGGYESRWRLKKSEYLSRLEGDLVEWKNTSSNEDDGEEDGDGSSLEISKDSTEPFSSWKPYIKFYMPESKTVQNIWSDIEGNKKGKRDLKNIMGHIARLTPKPIDLVKRVAVISTQPGDYVLDYFGGTGTTACSILKLNSESNGSAQRRWMLCEMGSVFDVARKRVCRSLFSQSWESQKPKDSGQSGTLGCVKVQTFEQYEDLLDNLQSVWDEASLPKQIPVKYLFRPEQNQLISTLDLSRPFAQTLCIGKDRQEKTIDLMETWCYLQGYWVRSRRVYREFDRTYLVLETTHGTLVVFRDIDPAEDDTANLSAILARYIDEQGASLIQQLELNFDADLRRLAIDTRLIQASDFLRGVHWH
ncbi:site-specific DNA-methyltransferase [Pseudomonas tolaasii]|uniref:site-specific DNA-methyltransferase (adenine-specific) n=2 Tax=Gammaproteobacteria TaxID=1236 RepID=A0ABX4QAI7_PSETO|nr:site-specific DNA-methyltransferase [Pseudomonas tolaasii]ARB28994.1 hypothetical protein B5P22_17440 [Pseudomonas tolaasii]KAB0474808.1 site-specific DNA-methyltransferase [Pseudomonas tolaasii]PKA73768.1 DNA methylase [Pseudomonas tolaasii NCPPB 2192]